jgi:hypothetical protein
VKRGVSCGGNENDLQADLRKSSGHKSGIGIHHFAGSEFVADGNEFDPQKNLPAFSPKSFPQEREKIGKIN